jgi:hypothetical protein
VQALVAAAPVLFGLLRSRELRPRPGTREIGAPVVSSPFLWEPEIFWNNDSTVTHGAARPGERHGLFA